MSQFFELHYHLPEDPARLFDVAQGLAGRRNILKRGGSVKVKPFTAVSYTHLTLPTNSRV